MGRSVLFWLTRLACFQVAYAIADQWKRRGRCVAGACAVTVLGLASTAVIAAPDDPKIVKAWKDAAPSDPATIDLGQLQIAAKGVPPSAALAFGVSRPCKSLPTRIDARSAG